jgi:hypothetical protein
LVVQSVWQRENRKKHTKSSIGGAEKPSDELSVGKGGRSLTSSSSWEKGAQDGEAYMLFSSLDAHDKEISIGGTACGPQSTKSVVKRCC